MIGVDPADLDEVLVDVLGQSVRRIAASAGCGSVAAARVRVRGVTDAVESD